MNDKEELLLQPVDTTPEPEPPETDQADQEPSLLDRWRGWANAVDL